MVLPHSPARDEAQTSGYGLLDGRGKLAAGRELEDPAQVVERTEMTRVAKALADPQRCEILERMATSGELCVSDLQLLLPLSQATISHHLKELATAGLVLRRKEGQFGYYRFQPEVLAAYLAALAARMRPH